MSDEELQKIFSDLASNTNLSVAVEQIRNYAKVLADELFRLKSNIYKHKEEVYKLSDEEIEIDAKKLTRLDVNRFLWCDAGIHEKWTCIKCSKIFFAKHDNRLCIECWKDKHEHLIS